MKTILQKKLKKSWEEFVLKIAGGKNYAFHARIFTPGPSLVFQKPKCPETGKKSLKMGNVRLYFVIATKI